MDWASKFERIKNLKGLKYFKTDYSSKKIKKGLKKLT
jgi:hypothetical protein